MDRYKYYTFIGKIVEFVVRAVLFSSVFILLSLSSQAQVIESDTVLVNDSTISTDTTLLATDSLAVATDTIQQEGPIETTIKYFAKDSLNYDPINGTVYLYGEAKVTYGDMTIEAAEIQYNMAGKTVHANGVPDSTGTLTGIPIFTQGGQTYNAENMTYNMETEKGIISGIVTQQGDGYIKSGKVKRTPDNAMYAAGNIYTTCNLEEPHFGIRSKELKIVPNKYVISGPFNFELNGVPTPLGFAFGLFPFSDKRSAGIVVPTYGESSTRGFYLRNGGFYLPVGDYMGVQLLGQIYSLGGWGASIDSDYKVRYKFSGGLSFSYNKVITQQDNLEDTETTDYWLRWNHSPVSKGNSRFSASVNVGSSTYNRNNSFSTEDYISASFNSSVSYSKTFEGTPFTGSANLRINQNVNTGVTDLYPEANLSMRRIYPFKGNSTKKNPLTQLNVSYSVSTKAQVTNEEDNISFPFTTLEDLEEETDTETDDDDDDDLPDDLFANFSRFLNDAQYGAIHKIPVSTNLTLLKFFQLSPSFSYNEYWYPQKFNYTYVEEEDAVRVTEEPGFTRAYDYTSSVGMSTRLYTFYYPKIGKVEGIRHMITPSVSYSYRPDFSDPRYGFFQYVQKDETGETYSKVSRFQGALYGAPSSGKSSSVSFSLSNQIEAKVRAKPDSTGKAESKKVPILQSLSLSTSYNFAADSFNLSNISMSARTQLFKNVPFINGLSVNLSGTLDPYTYVLDDVTFDDDGDMTISQHRIPEYAWDTGNGIGQLTSASLALSTSLSPKKKNEKDKDVEPKSAREKEELEFIENNPNLYVDFSVPWSLRLSYNLRYSKTGFKESTVVQTLTFSGDVSFTEKWKIGFRSSYDFEEKGFGFTSLNISRDLHCWQMSMSWIPFGARQSYNIDISVRSSILQDLKLSKRNTWYDR
ncbi:putative LPS assembly protein LptD [Chondrinema litorale]|uniref:putative LPS assembly protein LptD n=1 Tax=Chondrinema litorale TaxID=2994555 RepID=UPI002543EA67|nr:putative LPS assembly protein LptD [Chondrinema litorale]UZR94522.1 putative LPS assembly protein LptD [Chondrinema litorale]